MLNRCDYLAVGLSNVSRLLLDCLVFRFLPFLVALLLQHAWWKRSRSAGQKRFNFKMRHFKHTFTPHLTFMDLAHSCELEGVAANTKH